MRMKIKDILLILVVCVLWGMDFILAKGVITKFNNMFFPAVRFAIVAICFLPFIKRWPENIGKLMFAGIMLVVVSYGAADTSNKLNSSTLVTGTLAQLDTVIAIVCSFFILREKTSIKSVIGIVVAVSGMILISLADIIYTGHASDIDAVTAGTMPSLHIDWQNLIAISVIFIGLAGWPAYVISMQTVSKQLKPQEIVAWTALFGSFVCLCVSFLFPAANGQSNFTILMSLNWHEYLVLLYAGIGGVLIPNLVWQMLMTKYNVNVLGTFALLVPVVTALGSIFMLNEKYNIYMILGMLIIIFGIFYTNLHNPVKKDA